MTVFKAGDQVRLKAKPEITGLVFGEPIHHGVEIGVGEPGRELLLWRYPEELELVPRPLQVGDRVATKAAPEIGGTVISEGPGWLTVKLDPFNHPAVYSPDWLVRL